MLDQVQGAFMEGKLKQGEAGQIEVVTDQDAQAEPIRRRLITAIGQGARRKDSFQEERERF